MNQYPDPCICADTGLLSLLPPIRRTRGWRLYGENGTRFLDMYCDGGRTIMGKKAGTQGKLAKACIDMGVVSGLPTIWTERLLKALRLRHPEFTAFRFYSDESKAAMSLSALHMENAIPRSMAFGEYRSDLTIFSSCVDAIGLCILPLAPVWAFGIIAASKEDFLTKLSPGDPIPPIKLALATKALGDLQAFACTYAEEFWLRIDPYIEGIFIRKGPWLYPAYKESSHETVFNACLSRKILISPDYSRPSCIPGEYDEGEISPLGQIQKLI